MKHERLPRTVRVCTVRVAPSWLSSSSSRLSPSPSSEASVDESAVSSSGRAKHGRCCCCCCVDLRLQMVRPRSMPSSMSPTELPPMPMPMPMPMPIASSPMLRSLTDESVVSKSLIRCCCCCCCCCCFPEEESARPRGVLAAEEPVPPPAPPPPGVPPAEEHEPRIDGRRRPPKPPAEPQLSAWHRPVSVPMLAPRPREESLSLRDVRFMAAPPPPPPRRSVSPRRSDIDRSCRSSALEISLSRDCLSLAYLSGCSRSSDGRLAASCCREGKAVGDGGEWSCKERDGMRERSESGGRCEAR